MAFVCTLTGDSFNADVATRGSSRIVTARIGVDDERDIIYSVMVCLDPGGGGDMELVFAVVAADTAGREEPTEYLSGIETASLIRGADREIVLSAIIGCVGNLVRAVQPPRIYMCTYDTDLPDRAVRKHIRVARAIETCGYYVKYPDPFHGQHIWYMERRE
ncbi:hypothetical protein V5F79_22335 [Xanthobacter flavus]|uniref:hypothetical protein n=1 Tax=Xanthobacter flavus TaxID=281 RepID=UPI003726FFC2